MGECNDEKELTKIVLNFVSEKYFLKISWKKGSRSNADLKNNSYHTTFQEYICTHLYRWNLNPFLHKIQVKHREESLIVQKCYKRKSVTIVDGILKKSKLLTGDYQESTD